MTTPTQIKAEIDTLRGRLAEFELVLSEPSLLGAISQDESREICEELNDLNRSLVNVLPTPYCEACKSYHVTPYTAEHHAKLRCRAAFRQ